MTSPLKIPLQRLPHAEDLPLPTYATSGSVGADLCAAITHPVVIEPGTWKLIPTGFSIALPVGTEAQIRSRSGLALKQGLMVLNSPGTIDQDYRGDIGVILMNHGKEPVTITRGMRIAQLVIAPVIQGHWEEVSSLLSSDSRGADGFGSTGV